MKAVLATLERMWRTRAIVGRLYDVDREINWKETMVLITKNASSKIYIGSGSSG